MDCAYNKHNLIELEKVFKKIGPFKLKKDKTLKTKNTVTEKLIKAVK